MSRRDTVIYSRVCGPSSHVPLSVRCLSPCRSLHGSLSLSSISPCTPLATPYTRRHYNTWFYTSRLSLNPRAWELDPSPAQCCTRSLLRRIVLRSLTTLPQSAHSSKADATRQGPCIRPCRRSRLWLLTRCADQRATRWWHRPEGRPRSCFCCRACQTAKSSCASWWATASRLGAPSRGRRMG